MFKIMRNIIKNTLANRKNEGCVIYASGRRCLEILLLRGILSDIAKLSIVCGISIFYKRMPLGAALRRVRADIITLEVMGERRSLNAVEKEELNALRSIESLISKSSSGVKVVLAFHVCGGKGDEVLDVLEAYGCRASQKCGSFFRSGAGVGAGYPFPLQLITDVIYRSAVYLAAIEASNNGASLPIGVEPTLKAVVGLPIIAPHGALHTLIVGPTGRGKTTLLSLIAMYAIIIGLNTYIIDPKGDLMSHVAFVEGKLGSSTRARVLEHDAPARLLSFLESLPSLGPGIVLVDEAWRISRSVLERMFRVARSYGVVVVASSHYPSDFSSVVWANTSSAVVFGSSDSDYVRDIEKHVSVRDIDDVEKLGVGEALVSINPWPVAIRARLYAPLALLRAVKS